MLCTTMQNGYVMPAQRVGESWTYNKTFVLAFLLLNQKQQCKKERKEKKNNIEPHSFYL